MPSRRVITLVITAAVTSAAALAVARPAAGTAVERGGEYVVYVDRLDLTERWDGLGEAITELKEGTRLTAVAGEITYRGIARRARVRAGEREGWVRAVFVAPAADYDRLRAEGALDRLGPQYVVVAAGVKLRREPSADAPVTAFISAGTRLGTYGVDAVEVEGVWWRRVRFGGGTGWVPDEALIPDCLYERYKPADAAAREGDAAAMLAAVDAAARDYQPDGYAVDYPRPSPDGAKVVVTAHLPRSWLEERLELGRELPATRELYFVAGRGLCRAQLPWPALYLEGWVNDSRHIVATIYDACFGPAGVGYIDIERLDDVDANLFTALGRGNSAEVVGTYVVWLNLAVADNTAIPEGELGSGYVPAVRYYDVATGKGGVALAPDYKTVRGSCYTGVTVRLVPSGICPAAVAASALYKECEGQYERVFYPEP